MPERPELAGRSTPIVDATGVGTPAVDLLGARGWVYFGTMKHAAAALLFLAGAVHSYEPPRALVWKTRIDLPGVTGRIDHFSVDLKGQRLFMAALGNHTVEVLDVQNGKVSHTIPDLAEPQGVFYDSASNRLFVASAKDGTAKVFDAGTLQLADTIKFSGDADNIRYDARGHRIIVGYGDGALGLLDSKGRRIGDIPLDAHPESFQVEKSGNRVFVNVPDRKQIEVVDLEKRSVVSKWPVTSALRNYPMALDENGHRLLAGCRSPARMLAIDTDSGKQTASVEIVGDTDDLFYDAAGERVYVIGGQGFVDVFQQTDADHYRRLDRVATAPGARTGLLVPEWHKLFIAVPQRGERRAQVLVFETR